MSKRCREPPRHQCQLDRPVQCCVGPKGATGVTGATGVQLQTGVNYSDYLFWNSNTSAWEVGDSKVHLGANAGGIQGIRSVAIGDSAGDTQGNFSVAIGVRAGNTAQGDYSVAVGAAAGNSNQGGCAVAVGNAAGSFDQGTDAVAIGNGAGTTHQSTGAVALGTSAGTLRQGDYAIAIGYQAGFVDQAAKSIILNASDTPLQPTTQGLFIEPILEGPTGPTPSATNGVMWYDSTSKEVTWEASTKSFVINHPTSPDRYLVHACLEGPESGVYYRGESELVDRCAKIALPDYVPDLADNFTVQLTQIWRGPEDTFARLSAGRVGEDGTFTVHGDPCAFAWHVHGTRQHIDTEPLKAEVKVAGDGPYRYIQ